MPVGLIIEVAMVTVKCRTAIKALLLYFDLCLSVTVWQVIFAYFSGSSKNAKINSAKLTF